MFDPQSSYVTVVERIHNFRFRISRCANFLKSIGIEFLAGLLLMQSFGEKKKSTEKIRHPALNPEASDY